jgi:hypothetical protein
MTDENQNQEEKMVDDTIVEMLGSEPQELFEFSKSSRGNIQDCKCLICNEYCCEGSMATHLRQHQQGREYGVNYVKLDEYGQPMGKKPRKPYGSSKGKKIYHSPRPVRCLVDGCGWTGSDKTVYTHQKTVHNQGQAIGVNFEYTGEMPTKSSTIAQDKRKYQKRTNITLQPQGGYITVPVYIRIPIILGQAEIVQDDRK